MRNNRPHFTDDEGCIAYDAIYRYLTELEADRIEYERCPGDLGEAPGGLLRSIAAARGALEKLGGDR